MKALIALVACTACTRQVVSVYPAELALHAQPLVERGEAEMVDTSATTVRVDADTEVDVRVVDGDTQTPTHTTIRELVAGCLGGMSSPTCLASKIPPDPVTLRSKLRLDRSRVSTAVAFAAMGGAIGVCVATCQGRSELQKDLGYGAIGVAGVLGLFVVLLALGG